MERPPAESWSGPFTVEPEQLECEELRHAVKHTPRTGRCFRFRGKPDGLAEDLELVYFPDAGRAGIAWREGVWWLSSGSPDEAVRSWTHGAGRSGRSRLPRRAEPAG